MEQKLRTIAQEISNGIPSSYHLDLGKRLAIAWGGEWRETSRGKGRTLAKIQSLSRESRARRFYLRVQHENLSLFLPFILAYSPRACVDLRTTNLDHLREYGWKIELEVHAQTETKKLIDSIAVSKGVNQSISYSLFQKNMFPEELQNSIIPLNNPYKTGIFDNASLQGIAEVFTESISEAIGRNKAQGGETTGAITMRFPENGTIDCVMSLDIHESKVEDLAKALFNVQVGSRGNIRYLVLPEGVRVTPTPELTLKGVLDSTLIHVFGLEIHTAVTSSILRAKELLEEGNDMLEGVSMILTNNSSEWACITLVLGLSDAYTIWTRLYPDFQTKDKS